MSDTNQNTHRGRRKAVRSAGPPVDEVGGADVTVRRGRDAVESASAGKGFASAASKAGAGAAGSVSPEGGAGSLSKDGEGAVDSSAAGSLKKGDRRAAGSGDSGSLSKSDGDVAGSSDAGVLTKGGGDVPGSAAAGLLTKADRGASEADAAGSVPLSKSGSDSSADADPTVELSKADAAESDSSDPKGGGESDSRRPGVGRILLAAAAAVLVVALVAGAVVSVFLTRSIDQRDARRAEYVQTARQAILNLTTINADSAKEDIDRILSMASGQFKTEFDGRVDPFLSIVQQAEVRSSGEIVEAALESDADDSAKVLVAAKQTLTNAGQAEPQTRFYRFRVTVTDTDGGLTASNVEFVP